MNEFFWGVASCSCWGAGTFFLRYWRQTRDRFFLLFACAFWVMSLNWVVLASWPPAIETRHFVYLIRLAAFALIIGAVWDKNRVPR